MRKIRLYTPWAFAIAVFLCAESGAVDFDKDIRPIFEQHCIVCHGAREQRGGLRLDYLRGMLEGGDHGPAIVPGEPDLSRMILRITGQDPDGPAMPFEKEPLTERQIERVRRWIADGASWAQSPVEPPRRTSDHWAFQSVRKGRLPDVAGESWVRNPIDRFVLALQEANGIKPSSEADRTTLLRRVYLDLTGLPPSPVEVDAFLADRRSDAYEQWVDRLLNSPAYGERWGRHWLDQARYADSNGYSVDSERVIWPYRDWVIAALNHDTPFDRFTIEQLAGDLLESPTPSQLIATGFHRNTLINQEGGSDAEQFRVEATVDRANTTGSVWLGLTIACAQCHTHKFDPILQKEYYQLYAFFNSAADKNSAEPQLALPTDAQAQRMEELKSRIEAATRSGEEARVQSLTEQRKKAEQAIVKTLVMRDLPEKRASHVHVRGDFLRHGPPVHPDVPQVLPPLGVPAEAATRLDLAHWLVRSDHPLTPRVTVNRHWMRLFGQGLVETENDFGLQGTAPTHPALLDWLSDYFIASGWSVKRLHRLIVTSATYRQSSNARPDLHELDPLNKLLARQNRFRVEAEIVRDVALTASGMLTRYIGGPSVHPPQPEGVFAFTQTKKKWPTDTGPDRYRRGLYTFFYRSAPHPQFGTFDVPDMQQTCTRRLRSNTPLQALAVANDPAMLELAVQLARRATEQNAMPGDPTQSAVVIFRHALSRNPTERELTRLLEYRQEQFRSFSQAPSAALQVAWPGAADPVLAASWVAAARVVMNLDEFITRE